MSSKRRTARPAAPCRLDIDRTTAPQSCVYRFGLACMMRVRMRDLGALRGLSKRWTESLSSLLIRCLNDGLRRYFPVSDMT